MQKAMKPSNVREENIKQIINTLRNSEELLSRAQISRKISLSPPSVSKIINILINEGILIETREGDVGESGGRKPILLKINEKSGYLMGIYIERGMMIVLLANLLGEVVYKEIFSYEEEERFDRISFLKSNIQKTLENYGLQKENIVYTGISVTGVFDPQNGVIKLAPNIKGWENIPLQKELQEYLDCTLVIENAVNMAVLAERWKGAINGCNSAVYIKVSEGIGAGILINGEIYRGHKNSAGEVGFMVSDNDYLSIQENNYGSMEKVCSTKFIEDKARKILQKKDINLNEIITQASENEKINEMLKDACQQLAIAIANIICVLSPETVVIGGKFKEIALMYNDYINGIIEQVSPVHPDIVFSELGDRVFYLGSIVQGLDNLEENLIKHYF